MAEEQSGGTKTTRTTTIETSRTRSYENDGGIIGYRPTVTPRSVIIQRTAFGGVGGGGGGGRTYNKERSVHYGMSGMSPGAFASLTTTGVTEVKTTREKEKKDMQDLNERFASYIEKVRFLEAQNRRLVDELEKLKSKWGKETSQIKAMYQAELDEARRLLDDAEKEKARLEIRVASLEEIFQELRQRADDASKAALESREQIEKLLQQVSDLEAEIGLLRRRHNTLETDREKDKKLIAQLQDSLNRARIDLDNETLLHIDAENRRQTLEEELEFLKTVHEQEMKELAALAYRDTTAENRDFWKNEMGNALREIQDMYDEKMDIMRNEIESSYNFKLQEFRTGATRQNMESIHSKEEIKRIKDQLTDLRARNADLDAQNAYIRAELERLRREKEERERELEGENNDLKSEVAKLRAEMELILQELQHISDSKLGLELEIAAYRKLLEGEESRSGLRQLVEYWSGGGGGGSGSYFSAGGGGGGSGGAIGAGGDLSGAFKGEMSARTTYQRSAKGPITIVETSADGKFLTLENTGRKEENIGKWKLTRNVDGEDKLDYRFSDEYVIHPGQKIKLWAKDSKPHDAFAGDIEVPATTLGVGSNITTKLYNVEGEDRATHIQKTLYSS